MSVNQLKIQAHEINQAKIFTANRLLGLFGIIGAPMLFLQFLLSEPGEAQPTLAGKIISFLGILYIGGWLAGAIGMRNLRITGNSRVSKIVFIIQTIGLSLALIFSILETSGFNHENGEIIFTVTDMAYPFSHLFMIVVGIFTWRAKVWQGISKAAPLLVGVAFPLTIALMPLISVSAGCLMFGGLTAAGLAIIGYRLINQS